MKALALAIGLVMVVMGIFGLIFPDTLVAISQRFATSNGLWAGAVLRVAVGIVLLLSATGSRAPVALKILGWVSIIAGIITPFYGVSRTQWLIHVLLGNPSLVRGWAMIAMLVGGLIIWAVRVERSAPSV